MFLRGAQWVLAEKQGRGHDRITSLKPLSSSRNGFPKPLPCFFRGSLWTSTHGLCYADVHCSLALAVEHNFSEAKGTILREAFLTFERHHGDNFQSRHHGDPRQAMIQGALKVPENHSPKACAVDLCRLVVFFRTDFCPKTARCENPDSSIRRLVDLWIVLSGELGLSGFEQKSVA